MQRIGIEWTGSYGTGLLRFMQQAGIEMLDLTIPDAHDRRRRGKNDDLDAESAAAFAGMRSVTPRSRKEMAEATRVLSACRKTAVAARRVALQMIQNTIVCAPDSLRELLRRMTPMQLVRTLAAAYRISLNSWRGAIWSCTTRSPIWTRRLQWSTNSRPSSWPATRSGRPMPRTCS